MLNGIGGRTITEAKERMSDAEYHLWRQYRMRHGTLNMGLRIERAAALTAWFVNNGKGQLSDYLPNRLEVTNEITLSAAMETWQ